MRQRKRSPDNGPKYRPSGMLGEVARGNKSAFATLYGLTNRKLLGVALKILRIAASPRTPCRRPMSRSGEVLELRPGAASPITWMRPLSATAPSISCASASSRRRAEDEM